MSHRELTREPKTECEGFEAALSAVVDGELDSVDLLPSLDHLADCPSCREFYRQARRLDGAVLAFEASRDSEAPPPAVWERIAESGAPPAPASTRGRWLPRLAAVLVVGFGIWALQRMPASPRPAATGEVEVVLASDGGRMDDARFVELATEVLEADRTFHRKMLEVMTAVTEYESREGSLGEVDSWRESADEDSPRDAGEEPERRDLQI